MEIGILSYEYTTNGKKIQSVEPERHCPLSIQPCVELELMNYRSISKQNVVEFLYKYNLMYLFKDFQQGLAYQFDESLEEKLSNIIHDYEIIHKEDIKSYFNGVYFGWTDRVIGDYARLLWFHYWVKYYLKHQHPAVIIF